MVKTRLNGETTFDENDYKRRAACVCFHDESETQVLLITSKHSTESNTRWLIAGGSIETGEEPRDAALREVFEESGVKGRLLRSLGQVVNEAKRTITSVYVMIATEVVEPWCEGQLIGRRRAWFILDKAKQQLLNYKPVHKTYIDLAEMKCELTTVTYCCGSTVILPTNAQTNGVTIKKSSGSQISATIDTTTPEEL